VFIFINILAYKSEGCFNHLRAFDRGRLFELVYLTPGDVHNTLTRGYK